MARYENILQAIGHTPLVRLRRIGADVASLIYAKVESLNPGGSVKDRVGVVPGTPFLTAWANGCDRAGARDYAAFLGFFFLEPS